MLPLLAFALLAFALGTEGFMRAGLLPALSTDLGAAIAAADQWVTAFPLPFALSHELGAGRLVIAGSRLR